MKKIKANQKLTVLTLVLALGTAVYLNWEYAKNTDIPAEPANAIANEETKQAENSVPQNDAKIVLDPLAVSAQTDPAADKNYGEAQLVSVNGKSSDEFFESARLARSKSRDEALDTLQKSLKNAKLSEEEKQELTAQLTNEVQNITAESDIESLVKAKGFVDCVAFIEQDKVNLTVMTSNEGLTKNEVAQIRDIVLSKCSVSAQNITVVEVK